MRDDAARSIKLADYRPPDYAIDDIALAFDLDPEATRVRARSKVRRNGEGPAPLVLDGVRLTLERIAIDGQALPPSGWWTVGWRRGIRDDGRYTHARHAFFDYTSQRVTCSRVRGPHLQNVLHHWFENGQNT